MSAVVSYRLVLPPPWVRVPLGEETAEQVRALVERAAEAAPREMPPDQLGPFKRELERRFMRQFEAAAAHGALDHYLPAAPVHGIHLGASFFVALARPEGGDGVDPREFVGGVLAERGSGPDARTVEIDGSVWVRTESTVAPDDDLAPGVDVGTRRVTYLTAVPEAPGQWIVVSFSSIGDGDPASDLTSITVELFDAIMSTWRWVRDGAAVGPETAATPAGSPR